MLTWPDETINHGIKFPKWGRHDSNFCLDFHGDPLTANLVVFSDGNHHMALRETMQRFSENFSDVEDIFYVTTPPGPIVKLLRHGKLQMGNLVFSIIPHIFISPPHVLNNLVDDGFMITHVLFMKNQGSVLLIKKENQKNIKGIADLARDDVRLFLSNPVAEAVSYNGYLETLQKLIKKEKIDPTFLFDQTARSRIIYGETIHHREAPESVHSGIADVAIVYYHLALRYTRIFPSFFEIIPLGGTVNNPQPFSENVISHTHAGIIGDGGKWGSMFLNFLLSDTVKEIYKYHGLISID